MNDGGLSSRRQILQRYFGFASVAFSSSTLAGQNEILRRAEPTREFKRAQFRAVSLDGRLACLYYWHNTEAFLRGWSYDGGNSNKDRDVLRVVELNTGKVIFATELRTMVVAASFFAGGTCLYAETLPMTKAEGVKGSLVIQRVAINTNTRTLSERLSEPHDVFAEYTALDWPTMLGAESSLQTARAVALTRTSLPNYQELARVPFAAEPDPPRFGRPAFSGNGKLIYGHDTTPAVSGNKKAVFYGAGHSLVCRSASDLNVLWIRRIKAEYFGAWHVGITPDSGTVVAAVIDDTNVANQQQFYVGVYRGLDGSTVNELPLNGFEGVSISPSGKLIAVSRRASAPGDRAAPTVDVHEVSSGRLITSVNHPPIDVHRVGTYGLASISSQFTPDGKYLLTSTPNTTRVWDI